MLLYFSINTNIVPVLGGGKINYAKIFRHNLWQSVLNILNASGFVFLVYSYIFSDVYWWNCSSWYTNQTIINKVMLLCINKHFLWTANLVLLSFLYLSMQAGSKCLCWLSVLQNITLSSIKINSSVVCSNSGAYHCTWFKTVAYCPTKSFKKLGIISVPPFQEWSHLYLDDFISGFEGSKRFVFGTIPRQLSKKVLWIYVFVFYVKTICWRMYKLTGPGKLLKLSGVEEVFKKSGL